MAMKAAAAKGKSISLASLSDLDSKEASLASSYLDKKATVLLQLSVQISRHMSFE
jgi:hypothetical protein